MIMIEFRPSFFGSPCTLLTYSNYPVPHNELDKGSLKCFWTVQFWGSNVTEGFHPAMASSTSPFFPYTLSSLSRKSTFSYRAPVTCAKIESLRSTHLCMCVLASRRDQFVVSCVTRFSYALTAKSYSPLRWHEVANLFFDCIIVS